MADITVTTAAAMIAQKWTKKIELPFYNALYFKDLVLRRDELVSDGNTLHIPFLSIYNARDKVAGTPVSYDANTEATITLTIAKQKYLAFLIEDIVKVQSSYALQDAYRGAQTEAVTRAMDTDLASLYSGAGTTVAAGATVTDATIISVVQALDLANVPQSQRAGIIAAKVMSDLRGVNKYVTYDSTGEKGVATSGSGMVPYVYGMELHMTNNVQDDLTNTHSMFFHKSAMSLAVQLPPTYKMEDSVDYIGMKTVLHTIYGLTVERPAALVQVTRNS